MKLKPYPKYKDSGIRWIGKIPQDWKSYRLKHVVNEFISGGTPSSDNEKFWTDNEDNKGIPWISIGDMTNNEVILKTEKRLTQEGLAEKGLKILRKGTLIYSIFASLGKVSVLGINATTNQAILGLITSKKIENNYLKYYLRNLEETIIVLSNANTQNNLNSTIVKNIQLAVPEDTKKQIEITSFLDKKMAQIDVLIEKDKKLIELLKERRTALINHAVTKGLDPSAKMKDSGIPWIGEIPEEWDPIRLKYLLNRIDPGCWGSDFDEKGTIILRSTEIKVDGSWQIDDPATRSITEKERSNCLLKEGDLLVTKSSGSEKHIGKTALVNKDIEKLNCCFSNFMTRLRPNREQKSKILHYFLNSDNARSQFNYFSNSTVGLGNLNEDCFKNLIFVRIPLDEQIKIQNFLDKATARIDKTIQKVEQKINLLEEYRKSLIHNVVTGKIDVREVE